MLTETKTIKRPHPTAVVTAPSRFLGNYFNRPTQFIAILLQFALIAVVIDNWHLENQALARLMWLAFGGFAIHHVLPQKFRLPFFALLSLLAVVTGVGHIGPNVWMRWLDGSMPSSGLLYHLFPGLTLVAVGLGLIGLCHLPIRFGVRIGLVAAAGAGLAFLRMNIHWMPDIADMWVILGSLFMFRLIVYLYDLKHRTAPFSLSRAVSYFFLLPNVCFPLFPVVDYKTFCSTYYNEDWVPIYQNGIRWMLRGVAQLLLYRIVYQYAPLDVSKLSSSLDAAGFMLGTYLLYLRVSGTFHL